jgi:hypothetical protein
VQRAKAPLPEVNDLWVSCHIYVHAMPKNDKLANQLDYAEGAALLGSAEETGCAAGDLGGNGGQHDVDQRDDQQGQAEAGYHQAGHVGPGAAVHADVAGGQGNGGDADCIRLRDAEAKSQAY